MGGGITDMKVPNSSTRQIRRQTLKEYLDLSTYGIGTSAQELGYFSYGYLRVKQFLNRKPLFKGELSVFVLHI